MVQYDSIGSLVDEKASRGVVKARKWLKMAEISSKDEIWQMAGPRQLRHSTQGRCHALQRCRNVIGHPRRCVEPGKQPGWQ